MDSFGKLPAQNQDILAFEMALTGCVCQSFSYGIVPKETGLTQEEPAFLI